jgi:hypothetical protein
MFRHYLLPDIVGIALVAADVRNACAFESSFHMGDKATRVLKSYIRLYYPDVHLSAATLNGNTVYLASKQTYERIRNQTELGKILGFSCANQWKLLNEKEPPVKYSYTLNAHFRDKSEIQIFNMMCLDNGRVEEMEALRKSAAKALQKDPVFGGEVQRVTLKVTKHISSKELATMLLRGDALDSWAKKEIQSSLRFSGIEMKDYMLSNPGHRGMLAALVLRNPMYYVEHMMENENAQKGIKAEFDSEVRAVLRASRKTRRQRR